MVKIISFASAVIVILTGLIAKINTKSVSYEKSLQNSYIKAVDELSENINNMQNSLNKSIYSTTKPQQTKILTNLIEKSYLIKEDISFLPLSDICHSKLNLYISQVGDYSSNLLYKISKGEQINSEDISNLNMFLEYSRNLNNRFSYIRNLYENDDVDFKLIDKEYDKISEDTENMQLISVVDGFSAIENDLNDYPHLIYDGPFSDNIMNKTSSFLESKEEISLEKASKQAAKYMGQSSNEIEYIGENTGNIALYCFKNNESYINITKQGGYIESVIRPCMCENVRLNGEESVSAAKQILNNMGIENMTETYYSTKDGICTVNFAYVKDGIINYSDLIKIAVEQNNGTLVSFSASSYLMNHRERDKGSSNISMENAKKSLSPNLHIKSEREAFIPTPNNEDVYCYEFKCQANDGQDIIIYINAKTAMEEDILVLLKYDGGTLVM